MDWWRTGFDGAIAFRYLAGHRGRRLGRFQVEHVTPGCFIAAPDEGGYAMELRGRRVEVQVGSASIVPPGQPHLIEDLGAARMVREWVSVRWTVLGTIDLFDLILPPLAVGGRAGEAISRIVPELNAAARACVEFDLGVLAEREARGCELLRIVLAESRNREGLHARISTIARMRPALELMQARLADPIGRAALARSVGLSETRFHVVFASALGCSPYAYFRRLRLARACELLSSTQEPIAAIAGAVGFRDAFHFTRSFTAAYGASPRAYRAQVRQAWS